MTIDEHTMISRAADLIQHALHAAECSMPMQIIDDGTTILIGSSDDYLTVRYQDELWRVVVSMHPYLQSKSWYERLNECVRDIAEYCVTMMPERGEQQRAVGETETSTDEAIQAAARAIARRLSQLP